MNEKRVLLLSADDETSHIVYHELKKSCDIVGVIIDVPVSKKKFLRKRIHRLGFMKVVDQVFYKMLIDPILKRISEKRVNGITYLQYAAAIPLLQKAIDLYFSGIRTIIPAPEGESHLYFHPTFTGYLYNLLINHVK